MAPFALEVPASGAVDEDAAASEKEKQSAADTAADRETALKDTKAARDCCQVLEGELQSLRAKHAEEVCGHLAKEEEVKAREDAVKNLDAELAEPSPPKFRIQTTPNPSSKLLPAAGHVCLRAGCVLRRAQRITARHLSRAPPRALPPPPARSARGGPSRPIRPRRCPLGLPLARASERRRRSPRAAASSADRASLRGASSPDQRRPSPPPPDPASPRLPVFAGAPPELAGVPLRSIPEKMDEIHPSPIQTPAPPSQIPPSH
nr:atherin-like [Aegilops tauschii subsp. strangulata]